MAFIHHGWIASTWSQLLFLIVQSNFILCGNAQLLATSSMNQPLLYSSIWLFVKCCIWGKHKSVEQLQLKNVIVNSSTIS